MQCNISLAVTICWFRNAVIVGPATQRNTVIIHSATQRSVWYCSMMWRSIDNYMLFLMHFGAVHTIMTIIRGLRPKIPFSSTDPWDMASDWDPTTEIWQHPGNEAILDARISFLSAWKPFGLSPAYSTLPLQPRRTPPTIFRRSKSKRKELVEGWKPFKKIAIMDGSDLCQRTWGRHFWENPRT